MAAGSVASHAFAGSLADTLGVAGSICSIAAGRRIVKPRPAHLSALRHRIARRFPPLLRHKTPLLALRHENAAAIGAAAVLSQIAIGSPQLRLPPILHVARFGHARTSLNWAFSQYSAQKIRPVRP